MFLFLSLVVNASEKKVNFLTFGAFLGIFFPQSNCSLPFSLHSPSEERISSKPIVTAFHLSLILNDDRISNTFLLLATTSRADSCFL